MSHTIIIIFFACLLGLGGAMRLRHDQAAKEAARQRAEETVKAYPWDWTQGDEKKVQAAMELICDKCHERHMCREEGRLRESCQMCPVPDVVYKLVAEGRKRSFDSLTLAQDDTHIGLRPQTPFAQCAHRAHPRHPAGEASPAGEAREEARG